MFKLLWVVLLVAFSGVAMATPVLSVDLNLCNAGLCAIDGIDIGTVVVKVFAEEVAGGINFTVATQNPGWLLWDGGLFGFNAASGGTLVLPPGFTSAGSGNEDGFGAFAYRINGPTAGGLGGAGVPSLSFSVTGLQLSDLTPNGKGHLFAAHVGVPGGTCGGGGTCAALTGFVTDGAQVPEPGTFGLLGGALIVLGSVVRRRLER
jgi:hypothetical protein